MLQILSTSSNNHRRKGQPLTSLSKGGSEVQKEAVKELLARALAEYDKQILDPKLKNFYTHDQIQSSDEWMIRHNLGRKPSVSVADSAGSVVYGDVQYLDDNSLIIRFSAPFGGVAYLN